MQIDESPDALSEGMAERNRRVDPFIALAVLFFLLAVALAFVPALNAGPEKLASLLLLVGLAGVCTLGLFVLRGAAEAPAEADVGPDAFLTALDEPADRKSTRLNSSHVEISYAVFCLKKKTENSDSQQGSH